MKHLIVWTFVLLMVAQYPAFAQYENVWVFGADAGFDFNGPTPTPIKTNTTSGTLGLTFGEAYGSVCDNTGQLLFYTEGFRVWDRQYNLMSHGDTLIPTVVGKYTPTSSSAQGTIIVPIPEQPQRYYVFSLTSIEYESQNDAGRLFYSIVDMSLNGGLGDVVQGSKGITLDSNLTESMTAVVGDRCNIWLLTLTKAGKFKAYEINAAGIGNGRIVGDFQNFIPLPRFLIGCMTVSPDRKKLAIAQYGGPQWFGRGITLFDFDVATCTISNEELLELADAGYSVSFSPDNSRLYVNLSHRGIFQYDVTPTDVIDIRLSKTKLVDLQHASLKLAPDNKIYVTGGDTNKLAVIQFPNNLGTACQLQQNVITLVPGTAVMLGLPNVIRVIPRDTSYTITSVDKCFMPSVSIVAKSTSGWDYKWNTGANASSFTANTNGTYWVSYYTSSCTFHTDTFHVVLRSSSLPAIGQRASCNDAMDGKAWFSVAAGDTTQYIYTWMTPKDSVLSVADSLINVPSGNYIVRLTTSAGCNTTLYFTIPVDKYNVSFTVSDTIICEGNKVSFQNTSPSFFNTWFWHFGDGDSTALQQPGDIQYASPGNYTIMLVGSKDVCADTVYKSIIVDSAIHDIAFKTSKDTICVGERILFTPNTDHTALKLAWKFGDGTELIARNESVQHAYDRSRILFVNLTASFRACPDISFTDTIIAEAIPIINLGLDTALCPNGPGIALANLHTSVQSNRFLWNTGATTQSIIAQIPGDYYLTITTPSGCANADTVVVARNCFIDIPNAFSPDGDGINDYFFPRELLAAGIAHFSMTVYNRWGQKVYETDQANGRGWDGRLNGALQPQDAYVYQIEVGFVNGTQERRQGNVTLLY